MTADAEAPPTPDEQYPNPDLVRAYIARRGVKVFHVLKTDTTGETVCGLNAAGMIEAGWARGLRRRGLDLCSKCARTVDLDDPIDTETEADDEDTSE